MLEKPFGSWKEVLWSDESKFNLFGSDGKVMVWRSTNEEFSPHCTVPTVKYQGGSVMVWGCFPRAGVGNLHFIDGTMDRFMYREILEKNLMEAANKLGLSNDFIFQHDNDPKHRAVFVNDWLKKKHIQILFYFTMSNLSLHDENDSNPSTIKQYSKYRAMFDYSLSTRWYRITTGPYSKQVDKKHKLLKHPFLIQWNPMDRIEHRRNHSTIDSNPKRRK
ncbi:unnamed protein product, partial [Rotaria magnacalcarata]